MKGRAITLVASSFHVGFPGKEPVQSIIPEFLNADDVAKMKPDTATPTVTVMDELTFRRCWMAAGMIACAAGYVRSNAEMDQLYRLRFRVSICTPLVKTAEVRFRARSEHMPELERLRVGDILTMKDVIVTGMFLAPADREPTWKDLDDLQGKRLVRFPLASGAKFSDIEKWVTKTFGPIPGTAIRN